MQMSAKMNSATFQNFNYETNNNLKLSNSTNAKNLKQSNAYNSKTNTKENLLLSNCESKLSDFTTKFQNTHKEFYPTDLKLNQVNKNTNLLIKNNTNNNFNNSKNYDENFSDSLENSQNGNMKILKSYLPYDLSDIYNKKFNLENFFNEVYYEKDLESLFIVYIKDQIVNSIDYAKIFIINNKNLFILQIPFDNGKTQIFRVDYGKEISMQNYTIEITEDILKIIISLENNFGEDKKITKIRTLHKLITYKLFFKSFKQKASNRIKYLSAFVYSNNKLKKKILNLLNYFYLIKIKENVNALKIRKFTLKKNNFLSKVADYKNYKNERIILNKFMLVKMFFNLFRFKAKKVHETIMSKNYKISMNTFHMKKFKEKSIKENVFNSLKKEVNKKNLERNNSQMAAFSNDFLTKRKYFNKIKFNLADAKTKNKIAFDCNKKNAKQKFFKRILHNRHFMKRFYYLSNKYNYFNYLFLFVIIQKYIEKFSNCYKKNCNDNDFNVINKAVNNNPDKNKFDFIVNIKNNLRLDKENIINESFSTINNNYKDSDFLIKEINQNNSNLNIDLNKSDFDASKTIKVINEENKKIGFFKNCEFKICVNFKNYIFANFYNNNFHVPLIKNIFQVLKLNMRKSKHLRSKLTEGLVCKKIKLNKQLNLLKIKMTNLRFKEHLIIQRKIFWNKFKIKLNQKKLQKILKEKRQEKIFRFTLLHNFIRFISQINQQIKIQKYFAYKKKFIFNKLLKFKFFQFLSLLYMKRKIEKKEVNKGLINNTYNKTHYNVNSYNNYDEINFNYGDKLIANNNNNNLQLKRQMPLLQSISEKFEELFISRLISPTNFIKDLKLRFSSFKRLLSLRLNYYKLIINCKQEKIIKRKTQKFKDACLKIYSKFYQKIKLLHLYKRQDAFKKQKLLSAFYSKIINKIKAKKRSLFIDINLVTNSKKLSFTTLKEYYLYKKSKALKAEFYSKKLKALFFKYNYESFFLKNAETLKLQNYFTNKTKKNQAKISIRKLKKIAIEKKVKFSGKNYLIKKQILNSLELIKLKNKEEKLNKLFSNKLTKYFFRYFLKNIKKLKIINKIKIKKSEAIKLITNKKAKNLISLIIANKAKSNLTMNNKETLKKKLLILKLKKIIKRIQESKMLLILFFKKIFIKKLLIILNKKKENDIKFTIIKKKFNKKITQKFLIAKAILSKTIKISRILTVIFDKRKKNNFFVFLNLLNQNNKEIFLRQRIRKIRIRQSLQNLKVITACKSKEKKKLKILKFKNCLKFFLNSILDKMLIKQNKQNIVNTIANYIKLKNLLILRKIVKANKKIKQAKIILNSIKTKQKETLLVRWFKIIKSKQKSKKIKKISLALFKRLLSDVLAKLQKNHFLRTQARIAKELRNKNFNKNLSVLKNYLQVNSKKRLLQLKQEAYANKFSATNNIKKFFTKVKKKISSNINCKASLRDKITQLIKLDSELSFSAYNANFQKYLKFNRISNSIYFALFLNRIKDKINLRNKGFSMSKKLKIKFALKKIKDFLLIKKNKNEKLKTLKLSCNKYLVKSLIKILSNIKHERVLITSFSQHQGDLNNISSSKLNNSILNYSDSFKLKIFNFMQQIRKSVKIKKSFEKFYQIKIISEGKLFVQKLKKAQESFRFKAYFENYFQIQNKLINYKFFLVRLQKTVSIKKEKDKSKKKKVFEILKQNAENEKLIKNYLEEAGSILY